MPPRRSERAATRINPAGVGPKSMRGNNSAGVRPKLMRGKRGYRKFKNGLLNVQPIGAEVDM
jgi:hypothetical protein